MDDKKSLGYRTISVRGIIKVIHFSPLSKVTDNNMEYNFWYHFLGFFAASKGVAETVSAINGWGENQKMTPKDV